MLQIKYKRGRKEQIWRWMGKKRKAEEGEKEK
jgi:hypothetical protein